MTSSMAPTQTTKQHFDRITIGFHWLTAVLVLALFTSALVWQRAPRDLGWRQPLQNFHVSIGILLAAVIIGRLLWRFFAGRRLPPADHGIRHVLAQAMHAILYIALVAQAVLGFVLRWFQGENFTFFGLFTMPALIGINDGLEHRVEGLHNIVGWGIIYLVAGHAAAALFHHYFINDGVLGRMIPSLRQRP